MARQGIGPHCSEVTRTTKRLDYCMILPAPAIYLTMDFWTSRQAHEKFMASHAAAYESLDAVGKELTLRERKIGFYEKVDL